MKFHQLGGQEKKERDLLARRAKAEKQRDIAQEDLNGQASDFSLILRASLAVVVMTNKIHEAFARCLFSSINNATLPFKFDHLLVYAYKNAFCGTHSGTFHSEFDHGSLSQRR